MNTATHVKMACPFCSGHIEFPAEADGQIITCPHCSQEITLQAWAPPMEAPPAAPAPKKFKASPKIRSSRLTHCRDCGRPISRAAKACPHCGKPKGTSIGVILGIIAGLIVIGYFILGAINQAVNETLNESPSYQESRVPRRAYLAGREALKKCLKAPSTAKFSGGQVGVDHDTDLTAEPLGNNQWRARGVVDAQNTFGAMIRSSWSATVHIEPQGYRVTDIYLDGEKVY